MTSILIFLFMKKNFDKKSAFFAFVFFVFSPFYILLSSRILTEPLSWFFLSSAIFAFWYAEKNDSAKYHLLAGFLTGIAFLTRYHLGVLAIVFVLYHFIFKKNYKILYFMIAAIITLSPWLLFSYEKCGSLLCLLLGNLSAATMSSVPFYYYFVVFLGVVGFVAPFVIYSFVKNYKNRFIILLSLFILILLVGLSVIQSRQFRFITVIVPSLAMIASIFPKTKLLTKIAIVLIIMNLFAGIFFAYFYFVYPDHLLIREAALLAKESVGKNDVIISNSPSVVEYFSGIKTFGLPSNETEFMNIVRTNNVKMVLIGFSHPSQIFSQLYGKFVPVDISYMKTIEAYQKVIDLKYKDQAEIIAYKIT